MAEQYLDAAQARVNQADIPSLTTIRERFQTAFDHVRLPFDELRYGTTMTEGLWFWKRILSVVFPEFDDGSLTEITNSLYDRFGTSESWAAYPAVREVLDTLQSSGVKLALLSNFDARGPGLLHNLGLYSRFDLRIFSSDVGFEKPDEVIFERVLDQLDGSRKRVIMIGNHVEIDLQVPDSMGWETLLHKPGSDDSWKNEITSWNQVLEYI